MKEKYEQFVDYFRKGNAIINNVKEQGGQVIVQIAIGNTIAEVRYDGYMVSIVHYLALLREPGTMYYRVNELDSKLRSKCKIGVNVCRFNGAEYLCTLFARLGEGEPYSDADNFFDKYDQEYGLIEDDINEIMNYV